MFCTSCGANLRPRAAFCDTCGAGVVQRPTPPPAKSGSSWVWLGAGFAAGLAVVAASAFFLVRDGGEGDEGPLAASPESVGRVQEILASLPALEGESDLEQLRSLLGPPDAFTIFEEPLANGARSRTEEWFYYEFYSMFEFVDGTLVANLPLDDPPEWLVLPRQYDPSMFVLGETWEQVSARIPEPGTFTRHELEPEYELPATYYAANQLLLLFDEGGRLLYVEAVPLEPGEELTE